MNGLLDELRSTEDALSESRLKNQVDVNAYQSKISELQNSLNKANDSIEDFANRSRSERTGKVSSFMNE